MEAEALNTAAVIAGTVAAFILGMILYHPRVLGTIWANGSNVDLGGSPPVAAFVLQILGLLSLALVIGMTATINFLGTALLAIAAAALMTVGNGVFSRKSKGALMVDGLYILGGGVLMIAAQGLL